MWSPVPLISLTRDRMNSETVTDHPITDTVRYSWKLDVAGLRSLFCFITISSKNQAFFFIVDFHFNTSRKIQKMKQLKKQTEHFSHSLQRFASLVQIHKVSRPVMPPSDWTCASSGPSGPWCGTVFYVPPSVSSAWPPPVSPSAVGTLCVWHAASCGLSSSCGCKLCLEHGAGPPPTGTGKERQCLAIK